MLTFRQNQHGTSTEAVDGCQQPKPVSMMQVAASSLVLNKFALLLITPYRSINALMAQTSGLQEGCCLLSSHVDYHAYIEVTYSVCR